MRKPKTFREHVADSERLRAKAEKLRMDFINADLDVANTFLDLARFDFRTGQTEHATRLVQHAARAAEVIGGLMRGYPETAALRSKLEALNKAIREVKGQAS